MFVQEIYQILPEMHKKRNSSLETFYTVRRHHTINLESSFNRILQGVSKWMDGSP